MCSLLRPRPRRPPARLALGAELAARCGKAPGSERGAEQEGVPKCLGQQVASARPGVPQLHQQAVTRSEAKPRTGVLGGAKAPLCRAWA